MRPTSKAQARWMGAIAGGAIKVKGFAAGAAKDGLRGVKLKKLPARAKKQ